MRSASWEKKEDIDHVRDAGARAVVQLAICMQPQLAANLFALQCIDADDAVAKVLQLFKKSGVTIPGHQDVPDQVLATTPLEKGY